MTGESPDAPRLCLAIPYFSNLDYLDVALRSLIVQSDPQWTAIVVDDASPEGGAEELVAALGDVRVRYVRNEKNLGIAGNFNRCLELGAAQAEIVTVFHADDALDPGYVAAVRNARSNVPEGLMCCAARDCGRSQRNADTNARRFGQEFALAPSVADDAGG